MHELSIAQAIVDAVEEEAKQAEATRVVSVSLELGELSGVVEHSLRFCFPIATRGTLMELAELEIERVEGRGWCAECETEFAMMAMLGQCPTCGGFASEIRAGQELTITGLVVE